MNSHEKEISDLTRVWRFYWRNESNINCLLLNTTHRLFFLPTKSDGQEPSNNLQRDEDSSSTSIMTLMFKYSPGSHI